MARRLSCALLREARDGLPGAGSSPLGREMDLVRVDGCRLLVLVVTLARRGRGSLEGGRGMQLVSAYYQRAGCWCNKIFVSIVAVR